MDPKGAFAKQPARILLLDFTGLCDIATVRNVQQTLEHFFALICSMYGPPRVPFFGLFALGNCPETLFALQHVKGNFPRLQAAFKELISFHEESNGLRPCVPGDGSSVMQGIVEATNMFKRQAQSLLQVSGCSVQLEMIVMTNRNSLSITKQVEKALQQLSVESIKKVQVVCVTEPERLLLLDEASASQAGSSSDTSHSSQLTSSMVDHVNIENNTLSLASYFRSWLRDTATDREHLHLLLPPANQENDDKIIKCDLHERLLSPELTQYANCYNLHSDCQTSRPLSTGSSHKAQTRSPPTYRLRVVQKLPAHGLCESVLFGLPSIVISTNCWRIDWDELEKNEKDFQALCHLLETEKEVLLAVLEDEPASTGTQQRGFRYQVPVPKPRGHFILLPSQSNALLLKSVAVSEFLLPCDFTPNSVLSPHSALQTMQDSLSKVEHCELYNPLLAESGLYPTLVQRLTKNVPATAAVGKRKANPPTKPQSYTKAAAASSSSSGLAGVAPLTFTSASNIYPPSSGWQPGPGGDDGGSPFFSRNMPVSKKYF